MSAVLSYPGGKSRIARQIVALMGTHNVYVEPFSGTAAVLMAKRRVGFELVNDLDRRLVTFLRVLRDRPADLAAALSLTPYSRAEYREADPDAPELDDLEVARRVAVRVGQSFAKCGLVTPSKGWRISTRGGRACAQTWSDLPDRVLAAADRLRGVHIDCLDATALIDRYGADPDALLYVDPPYLGSTRKDAMYAHEMQDGEAHGALADTLAECRAHVLLSGYHSPLYDVLYSRWEHVEIEAVANHNGNASGTEVRRTEVVWSNRPLPKQGDLFALASSAPTRPDASTRHRETTE